MRHKNLNRFQERREIPGEKSARETTAANSNCRGATHAGAYCVDLWASKFVNGDQVLSQK